MNDFNNIKEEFEKMQKFLGLVKYEVGETVFESYNDGAHKVPGTIKEVSEIDNRVFYKVEFLQVKNGEAKIIVSGWLPSFRLSNQ